MAYALEPGFLPSDIFQNCADLDDTLAAEFLSANGVRVVANADLKTNGVAVGYLEDGRIASLSTNGRLFIMADREEIEQSLPRVAALLERNDEAAGEFPIA